MRGKCIRFVGVVFLLYFTSWVSLWQDIPARWDNETGPWARIYYGQNLAVFHPNMASRPGHQSIVYLE